VWNLNLRIGRQIFRQKGLHASNYWIRCRCSYSDSTRMC
jgi:hypothetical protein